MDPSKLFQTGVLPLVIVLSLDVDFSIVSAI